MPTQSQAIREFGSGVYALATGINKGKFGMWAAQYSERGGISWREDYAWDMPWGAAPLPKDVYAATVVQAYLLGISSQAADADACWQWLAYLTQQLPPDLFLPARTSQRNKIQPKDSSNQEALSAGSAALEGILLIGAGTSENIGQAFEALWKAVHAVLLKNEPAEEQLRLAQEKATQ
ncbi:MAG: type 2 periplasmic-binding domain-containing protein [Anaerolineae bacterium]